MKSYTFIFWVLLFVLGCSGDDSETVDNDQGNLIGEWTVVQIQALGPEESPLIFPDIGEEVRISFLENADYRASAIEGATFAGNYNVFEDIISMDVIFLSAFTPQNDFSQHFFDAVLFNLDGDEGIAFTFSLQNNTLLLRSNGRLFLRLERNQ